MVSPAARAAADPVFLPRHARSPPPGSAPCSVLALPGGPASLVHWPSLLSTLVHVSALPVPGICWLSRVRTNSPKQAYPRLCLAVTLRLWYAVETMMAFVVVVNFSREKLCPEVGLCGQSLRVGKAKKSHRRQSAPSEESPA